MKSRIVLSVFLTFIFLAGTGRSEEIEKESMATMKEVVVTGTRSEQRVVKIPGHVAVITADQIKASGAQSVPDILRSLGGILVRDLNGNGNNQVVDMAGFGETADRHVAVVINGRRINPIDQSGIRWGTIPIENIERIEVLHGSGSVLYGDNAMGGVINIITKDWKEGAHIGLEGAIGTHDTRKGALALDFGKGPVGFHMGFSSYKTDGYRDRSETDRESFYGKLRWDTTDNTSILFEANISRTEYQLPGSLTEGLRDVNREQSVNPSDEGKDEAASMVIGLETDWEKWGTWNLTLSRTHEKRDSDMASWWSFMDFDIITLGVVSKYTLENNFGEHGNRLTFGIDMYRTDYEAWRGFFDGAHTNLYDHYKKTFSAYIQDEFNLLDSLLLNMGVRYEDPSTRLGAEIGGERTEENISEGEWAWNLGLAYAFMPESKVYGRVYRSFRYPVVDEYTNMFTGVINNTLRQETATGYEAGMRLSLFSKLTANLRLFWLDVDDEIAWNNITNQNENLDETRHTGGEVDFMYKPCHYISLYGGAGYTKAEYTNGANDGKKIPLIPDWKGNAGLELTPGYGFKLGVQFNYVGERYFGSDYGNEQKKMEDYHTVDMSLTYKYRILEVFFNATNIFNEKYSDFGFYNTWNQTFNYYPMPEAVYFGGIRITF